MKAGFPPTKYYNSKENKQYGKLKLNKDEEDRIVISCYKLLQKNMTLCARYLNTRDSYKIKDYYLSVIKSKSRDDEIDEFRKEYYI